MAKFTPYAVNSLPVSGIDVNGLYFVKVVGQDRFVLYLRKADNSDWVQLGLINQVESVNGLSGTVELDLDFNNGILSLTGSSETIDFDARYDQKTDSISWTRISGAPTFALDNSVVKLSGNQTISGTKTFSSPPVISSAASANNHPIRKGEFDLAISSLESDIDNLESAFATGVVLKGDIDCSSNPNYPAGQPGWMWKVSAPGRIGGASGPEVEENDTITCKTASAGGTHASVGANYFISQSNVDQATESVRGILKIATDAQVTAGTDDASAVTSLKLKNRLEALLLEIEDVYVRYDTAQGLDGTEKQQARDNIGAASDSEVVKLSGNQTISGTKTFSNLPKCATSASANDDLCNLLTVNAKVEAAVAWGVKEF